MSDYNYLNFTRIRMCDLNDSNVLLWGLDRFGNATKTNLDYTASVGSSNGTVTQNTANNRIDILSPTSLQGITTYAFANVPKDVVNISGDFDFEVGMDHNSGATSVNGIPAVIFNDGNGITATIYRFYVAGWKSYFRVYNGTTKNHEGNITIGDENTCYHRLVRSGTNFSAWAKVNVGDSWTQVFTTYSIASNAAAYVGFGFDYQTSQNTGYFFDAKFNVGHPVAGVFAVNETGQTYIDASSNNIIDWSTFSVTDSANATLTFDISQSNDSGSFPAATTGLTEAQVVALGQSGFRYAEINTNISSNDTLASTVTSVTVSMVLAQCTAPSVTGTTPTIDATPTWSWSSTATTPAGTGNYRYQLDSEVGAWVDTTDLMYTPISDLSHGVHTLYVQEESEYGSWSESGSFAINVDITAPAAPVVTGTTSPTTDTTPTWNWVSGGGGGNGTFRYQLDSVIGSWVETTDLTYTPVSPLDDNIHTLYVQERDIAGNWSESGSFVITIDTTPPTAPTVTVDSPTNDTTPTWNWVAGGGGNGTFRYQLDSEAGSWIETTDLTYTATTLTEGSYTLYVQERDAISNWSESGSAIVVIDLTAPTAPTVMGTTSPTTDTTPTWTWVAGLNGNGIFRYSINSGVWVETTDLTYTPVTPLSDDDYILNVQERDNAGNWSSSGSYTIIVDTTAPSVPIITGTTSPTNDRTPTWMWESGGGGSGTFRYDFNSSGTWTVTTAITYTHADLLIDGYYTLEVQEKDSLDQWSASGTYTIQVKYVQPGGGGTIEVFQYNRNWNRWIFASICKHFDDNKGVYPLYIEGQYRNADVPEEFIELRVDGPWGTKVDATTWRMYVMVNVLIQCNMNDTNFHRIHEMVGYVSSLFTKIQLYKYGTGVGDDSSHFGCLKLLVDEQSRERLKSSHMGQIRPAMRLMQAIVDGKYETYITE